MFQSKFIIIAGAVLLIAPGVACAGERGSSGNSDYAPGDGKDSDGRRGGEARVDERESEVPHQVRRGDGERTHWRVIVSARGKRFVDCERIDSDRHGLTFRHRGGIARLAYGNMSGEMQDAFGYDPEVAERERRERAEKRHSRRRAVARIDWRGGIGGFGAWADWPAGYFRHHHGGLPLLGRYAFTAIPGSTNPLFSTNTLRQIVAFRNNGYSNISIAERLANQHFRRHSNAVYGHRILRPAVIAAPPYLGYVRNIYPRQIGTFPAGPSGGSLVPPRHSGFSQAGPIAPSLAPSSARR